MFISRLIRRLLIGFTVLAAPGIVVAVPPGFNVQARLTDSQGVNRDGTYSIQFTIFDTATGGTQLWTRTFGSLAVRNGNFQVLLGDPGDGSSPAMQTVFGGDSRFLEIRVLGGPGIPSPEPPLVPRQQLVSVPFALRAAVAETTLVSAVPIGSLLAYAGTVEPPGWIECDGRSLSQSGSETASWGIFNPANLFAAIGTAWGSVGAGSFNVPDLRGIFPRGYNRGKTGPWSDPDAATRIAQYAGGATGDKVGSYQADELKAHSHTGGAGSAGARSAAEATIPNLNTGITGGSESRPRNASVMYIIRVQ